MRLAQLQRPLGAAASGLSNRLVLSTNFVPVGAQWRVAVRVNAVDGNLLVEGRRGAKVKAQGHYRVKSKRTHPKKLGAKRTGDQYVIPGNIIFKQHGTHWWPGENCIMGRDHTIHAMATGYVKYYRDPARHPDRKYIGVVFNKTDNLPYKPHAERKRRLGKTAAPITVPEAVPELSPSGIPNVVLRTDPAKPNVPAQVLRLADDYTYREANWRIGRLVKTTGLQIKKYKSRRAYMRHRRWARERYLEGMKKKAEKDAMVEEDADSEWVELARQKQKELRAKKDGKKKKEKKPRARR